MNCASSCHLSRAPCRLTRTARLPCCSPLYLHLPDLTLSGSCSTSFQPRTCADPHALGGDGFYGMRTSHMLCSCPAGFVHKHPPGVSHHWALCLGSSRWNTMYVLVSSDPFFLPLALFLSSSTFCSSSLPLFLFLLISLLLVCLLPFSPPSLLCFSPSAFPPLPLPSPPLLPSSSLRSSALPLPLFSLSSSPLRLSSPSSSTCATVRCFILRVSFPIVDCFLRSRRSFLDYSVEKQTGST